MSKKLKTQYLSRFSFGLVVRLVFFIGILSMTSCRLERSKVQTLRNIYAAYNENDMDIIISEFDSNVEWIEPVEESGGVGYKGLEKVQAHLKESRKNWIEGTIKLEASIESTERIVAMVHSRIRYKKDGVWKERWPADVWTFRNGKIIQMRSFANRKNALIWAGVYEGMK